MSAVVRLARGVWPDSNPLRRPADRAEAAIAVMLATVFLLGSPAATVAAWHWADAAGQQVARIERAGRHEETAVLLQRVPVPSYTPYGAISRPARATWTAPDGARMTGLVYAGTGRAGTKVMIWTDASGHLVSAPLAPSQVVRQAVLAAAGAVAILAVLLLAALGVVRAVMNRRRLAAWAADWEATGPIWTSRR